MLDSQLKGSEAEQEVTLFSPVNTFKRKTEKVKKKRDENQTDERAPVSHGNLFPHQYVSLRC